MTGRVRKHPTRFPCHGCSKSFTRESILKDHWNATHDPDASPLRCRICNQKFKRSNDLKRHQNVQHEAKKYVCRGELKLKPGQFWGCGKSFARKDCLGEHHRSKTGIKCIQPMQEEEEEGGPDENKKHESVLPEHQMRSSWTGQTISGPVSLTQDFAMAFNQPLGEAISSDTQHNASGTVRFGGAYMPVSSLHLACVACARICEDPGDLHAHIEMHRKDCGNPPFHCSICKINFAFEQTFSSHRTSLLCGNNIQIRGEENVSFYQHFGCRQKFNHHSDLCQHLHLDTGDCLRNLRNVEMRILEAACTQLLKLTQGGRESQWHETQILQPELPRLPESPMFTTASMSTPSEYGPLHEAIPTMTPFSATNGLCANIEGELDLLKIQSGSIADYSSKSPQDLIFSSCSARCHFCQRYGSRKSIDSLVHHLWSHIRRFKKGYTCHTCSIQFRFKKSYERHIHFLCKFFTDATLQPAGCQEQFKSHEQFLKHLKSPEGRNCLLKLRESEEVAIGTVQKHLIILGHAPHDRSQWEPPARVNKSSHININRIAATETENTTAGLETDQLSGPQNLPNMAYGNYRV